MPTWRISLEESVRALRCAADEYRAALRLAQTGMWATDVDRIQSADGKVAIPGGGAMGNDIHPQPHDRAVFEVGHIFQRLVMDLEFAYERAALVYAYGAAWATAEVIAGRTPEMVRVSREDRQFVPGARPDLVSALTSWSGIEELEAAQEALLSCELAQAHAEDLASRPDLADHEASWMHDSMDHARGLADAAYAYGLIAERALHYVANVVRRPTSPAEPPSA